MIVKPPKILIGTLFADIKDYAIKDWFKNVCQLTYSNFDLCLVDNSKDKKYHKKIFNYFSTHKKKSNIGKLTVLHTPQIDKRAEAFMAFSANELRRHFLKHDYDWLLSLECDVLPPVDIIERLLSYNKKVIGATYFSGNRKTSYPMLVDLYYYNYTEGVSFSNPSYLKGFYEMTDMFEPKPYFGQGVGITLIHKDIVSMIPFRTEDQGTLLFYDSVFYSDLLINNIQNYVIPLICKHNNQNWDLQRKMIARA